MKNPVHKTFKKGLAKPDCQIVELIQIQLIFSPVKLKIPKKEESGDVNPKNKANKPKGKFKTNLMMPSMMKKTKGVMMELKNPKEIFINPIIFNIFNTDMQLPL